MQSKVVDLILVALTGTGWNLFVSWLREMDVLRRSNLFPALSGVR
jgi:hypothetical protein